MKRLAKFLVIFISSYTTAVAAVWGLLEAYSYFKGDYLKQILGSYWILIYGTPAIIIALIAFVKSGYDKNTASNTSNTDVLQKAWSENIAPRLGVSGRRSNYLKDLELKIKSMPFIYKGLEGYVMNDFVNVEIQSLDFVTLKVKPVFTGAVSTTDRLRNSKKVVLLGGGGIGKTTFQRHSILEIINYSRPSILHEREDVIPIYVPLKAVDNSSSFPILRYVLSNTSFLRHNEDIETLITLANEQKIFLFLDGYDEIQFAGSGKSGSNFVREELNLMVSFDESNLSAFIGYALGYSRFYRSLGYCRIWLSSRKEFFEQHPVYISALNRARSSTIWAVELTGIGDNRVRLINIIFDKYRKKSNEYEKLFDAEYFIQEIDESSESEIHTLSYNPLFLTIMCYIYARKVVESGNFNVKWGSSFNELVWECVTLLLLDLDEAKARDLPEAQKTALLRRRNAYHKEKEEFLLYFSSELFLDEQNIFDIDYIKHKIKLFFQAQYKSPDGEKIIKELDDDSINHPNFALQLIFAGIFIIVDKIKIGVLYDYPHRRFREVLASKYFIEHGHQPLLDNLERESFSELVYVFFSISTHQDEILRAILEKTRNHEEGNYCGNLAINCLNRKPSGYDPNDVLHDFFLSRLDCNEYFNLPLKTLEYFRPTPDFIGFLTRQFKEYLYKGRMYSFCLCFDFLYRYNELLLKELSINHLVSRLESKDDLALLVFLKHGDILEWFEENEKLNTYLTELQYMKDLFLPVRNKNQKIPYSQNDNIHYCYVIREEIIKNTWKFIKKNNLTVNSLYLSNVERKQYNVYFDENFLSDNTVSIKDSVKQFIIKESRIDYQVYRTSMKLIEKLSEPLKEIGFFTP